VAGELRASRAGDERHIDSIVDDEPSTGQPLSRCKPFGESLESRAGQTAGAKVQSATRTEHTHDRTGDVDEIRTSDDLIVGYGMHHRDTDRAHADLIVESHVPLRVRN
jgi:hypothetical protein